MYYLVDKSNESVREHDNKMALRRIKRKQPKGDSMRIIEGRSLAKALASEAKANAKAPVAEVKVKKAKVKKVRATKKSKKATKK